MCLRPRTVLQRVREWVQELVRTSYTIAIRRTLVLSRARRADFRTESPVLMGVKQERVSLGLG